MNIIYTALFSVKKVMRLSQMMSTIFISVLQDYGVESITFRRKFINSVITSDPGLIVLVRIFGNMYSLLGVAGAFSCDYI